MSFTLKGDIGNWQSAFLQCFHHHLCLVGRDNLVFKALEERTCTCDLVCRVEWRALKVKLTCCRVWANETLRVEKLKLVCVLCQSFKIANSKVTNSSLEHVPKSQTRQCSVATSTASYNSKLAFIDIASLNQISGCMAAVIHINHSPLSAKTVAELTTIACGSSVVDSNACNSSRCEVVDVPIQSGGIGTGWATMRQNTEWRESSFWSNIIGISWRIVKSIGNYVVVGK